MMVAKCKYTVVVPRICRDGWCERQRIASFFERHEAYAACEALQPLFSGRVSYMLVRREVVEVKEVKG